MNRYTFNVSKSRTYGRDKRAKKAVKLLEEKLRRAEGVEVKVSTELNQYMWSRGASKPPRKVSVEVEEQGGELYAYPVDQRSTPVNSQETGESEEKDYGEIVSGTVDEVKQRVEELESPDYDALLDAEKNNKDRKTVKEFLEDRE